MFIAAVGAALTVAALVYDNGGRPLHPAAAALRQHPSTATVPARTKGASSRARSSSPPGRPGPAPGAPATSTAPGSAKPGARGTGPATTNRGEPPPLTGGLLTSNPATSTSPARDLAVPAGFGPLLRRAWVAADPGGTGITAADVRSTAPGSVFYAEQPSVNTYWAVSSFVPTAKAEALAGTARGKKLLEQFRMTAVFERTAGSRWAYVGSATGGACASSLPAPVFSAWGMCSAGGAQRPGS